MPKDDDLTFSEKFYLYNALKRYKTPKEIKSYIKHYTRISDINNYKYYFNRLHREAKSKNFNSIEEYLKAEKLKRFEDQYRDGFNVLDQALFSNELKTFSDPYVESPQISKAHEPKIQTPENIFKQETMHYIKMFPLLAINFYTLKKDFLYKEIKSPKFRKSIRRIFERKDNKFKGVWRGDLDTIVVSVQEFLKDEKLLEAFSKSEEEKKSVISLFLMFYDFYRKNISEQNDVILVKNYIDFLKNILENHKNNSFVLKVFGYMTIYLIFFFDMLMV